MSLLRAAITTRAIKRASDGHKILSNGGTPLDWLIDMREAFLQPDVLDAISELFWETMAKHLPFQVAGMEVAAIPLLTAILMKAHQRGFSTNGLIIRKERKTTGLGKAVEGTPNTLPVVLVDDLINSAASLEKARVSLQDIGLSVAHVWVVIVYDTPQAHTWAPSHGATLTHLFRLEDFALSTRGKAQPPPQFAYNLLWTFQVPGGGNPYYVVPKSAPKLVDGLLYFGADNKTFYAVDAATGQEAWHYQVQGAHRKSIWSTCAVHEGKVYFGAYNGNMYCLNAKTGAELWQTSLCEWIGSSPLVVPQHNALYVGLEYESPRQKGSVVALNLATGEKLWERWLHTYQHGSGAYFAAADLVIFGTNDHTIVAYNAQTGATVWETPTQRSVKYPPVVDETRGIVAATSFDGNIYILNAHTGERLAAIPTENICYTTPLIHGKYLYAGSSDRHLYMVNLDTLTLEKRIDCKARVYGNPTFSAPNSILLGTTAGRVYELDADTLDPLGYLQAADAITNAIVADDATQRIFIPTYMGTLHACQRVALPQPNQPS